MGSGVGDDDFDVILRLVWVGVELVNDFKINRLTVNLGIN